MCIGTVMPSRYHPWNKLSLLQKFLIDRSPGHILTAVNHYEMYKLQNQLEERVSDMKNCQCSVLVSVLSFSELL